MSFQGGYGGGHRRNNNRSYNNNNHNNKGNQELDDLRSRLGGGNNSNGQVSVEIRGWQGGSKDDLVRFIKKKSQINLQSVRIAGPVLHASVRENEVGVLLKYSGIRFAGASLSISAPNSSNSSQQSPQTQSAVKLLETYLQNHYIPEQKLLNLSGMKDDPYLIENGLMANASTSSKMFPAMMKIGSLNIPDIESASLDSNGLTDVVSVTTLASTYPNLKNLSLANNAIARVKALENWRHKFPHLRELILSGNPITATPTYKADMIKLFPRLVMLDGQIVQDPSQVDTPRLPVPVKQNFFEDQEVQGIAANFLTTFFDFYDRDRSQLLPLYDGQSLFSLNVNSIAPRSMAQGAQPPWSSYISSSRNLDKITSMNARVNRLSVGPEAIASIFQRLPATKHDLKNPEKFSLDVWKINSVRSPGDQAIMICVHGEFQEAPNNVLRSFDRNLVLLPGPNGMLVASDMLTLRPFAGSDAWKESPVQAAPVPGAAPTPAAPGAPVIPEALQQLGPEQQQVVQQLIQQTRLTPEFALMCAQQAQFNYQQAFELFQQSQANNAIPPNAFQQF